MDAGHPGGQSFGQALGGALQLFVQRREIDRDAEFVGQEAPQRFHVALRVAMAHQFLHAGAEEGEVGGVDDAVAGQGDDVVVLQPIVGQHQAVADEGVQAGFLQTVQQGGALDGQLAAHVVFAAGVEFEEFAVAQLDAAGFDLHEQQVAGGAEHDDVDFAVAVLAVLDGVPGDAVKDVVAGGQALLQALQHVEFAVQAGVLADDGEAVEGGGEDGHGLRCAHVGRRWRQMGAACGVQGFAGADCAQGAGRT